MAESYENAAEDDETEIISSRDARAARLSFFNNQCACGMPKNQCLKGDPDLCNSTEAGNFNRDRERKERLVKLARLAGEVS